MTKREWKDRDDFERLLLNEVADTYEARQQARPLIALLLRHGKTYARIQEMNCNGVEWSHYDTNESFAKRQARHEAWVEKREKQLEKRITAICTELSRLCKPSGLVDEITPIFSGDPRGNTVKLKVPSGRTTDWGHEGVCVVSA